MKEFIFLLFGVLAVLNVVLLPVAAQDVVGCGGFVESTVPIKYEKVEVGIQIYTKFEII